MMEERRGDGEMRQAIALLQRDLEYIKEKIDNNFDDFKDHIEPAQEFRDKVSGIKNIKEALESHTTADRWLFALMYSMQIAIFTKVVGVW